MKIAVCTIIAKNYLALAKTLGDSLKKFHPLIDFRILIIDQLNSEVEQLNLENVILDASTDFIENIKYKTLAYKYDITELSTAVKPFYLEYLLQQGYEKALYFDPDILILQPIDQILQALDTSNIVLVPHILDPIPFDGCLPNEITLLKAGAYNLGFIGIANSQETHRFLAWWAERLEKYCRVAVEEGLFVDQKWIDLVPGIFKQVEILTARGYDVAYWNLNARHLTERDDAYWIDDELLVFFHFSGFNPDRPAQLSKHQNRLEAKALPTLAKLLRQYASLLKANGHDEYRHWSYGYSTFSNGVTIDVIARSLLKEAQQAGMSFPDPYDVEVEPSFFKWLNRPVANSKHPVGQNITNYLLGLHQRRLDLRAAFPDVLGQHYQDYLAWVNQDAISQGVHPAYIQNADTSDTPVLPSFDGVNVAGYLTAELGVGEIARGFVSALKSIGVPTALTDFAVGTPSRKEDNTLSGFGSNNPHPINLICVNADQVPVFLNHFGSGYFEQKYNIGVWWWELTEFPEQWWDRFAQFQEIWVGSVFAYQSISQHSPIPVIKIPPTVDLHLPRIYPKAYFDLPEEFIFLFAFDFFSLFERKNPIAIVEAFKIAFQPDQPVRLVLKCINGEKDPVNFALLKDAASDAKITILDRYLSKDEKNGLTSACDCYVSLHRSEGFGLGMAEAMFLEKPVIATGWSGNTDFMTVSNSYLVEYELVKIETDCGPYKQGQLWAEANIQHAAQLMREVYTQPEEVKKKVKRAAKDIRSMHSPTAVAKLISSRLDIIKSSSNVVSHSVVQPETPSITPPNPVGISPIPLEIIIGAEWVTKSRFGKLGLLLKKTMERLIRFYINHQATVNNYLLASNQFVREQAQQQQILVNQLEQQVVSLGEQISAAKSETKKGSEALQHHVTSQLLAFNQSLEEQGQQSLIGNLERQIASVGEQMVALQIKIKQEAEVFQHHVNLQLLGSNKSVEDRAQQQQALIGSLEKQVASFGEQVVALQTEIKKEAEILQHHVNLQLLASNQSVGEQVQQQQTSIGNLERQISSVEERMVALQTETKKEAEILQHHVNLQLLASNQSVGEQAQQQALISNLEKQIASLQFEMKKEAEVLLQKLIELKMQFAIRPYMQMPIFSSDDYGGKSLGYEVSNIEPHAEFDYLGFEEVFRGAESFIKERQSAYLPFFTDKNVVLDIGCGRGEFLELLTESGIQAIGIDTNPDMVKRCAEKGISNIVQQDCNQYLSSIAESSIDGIFSAQFIEHLPFEPLYKFLTLSYQALSAGGIFIAETVNPHCIEAMKTFYVDLTHVKPLFPEVMLFLCRSAGFSRAEIFYPNGHNFSEEEYWRQGEYAIIARK